MHLGTNSNLLPYCVLPVQVTQGELAHINKEQNRLGALSYEAPLIAIARMDSQARANPQRLDSWVTHPDERVVIALLNHFPHRMGLSSEQLIALVRRALDGASSNQVLWTPLLDAITDNLPLDLSHNAELLDLINLMLEKEEEFRRWIDSSSSPKHLADLLTFHGRTIHDQLAANSPCLDEPSVRALMGPSHRDRAMADNPFLSPAANAVLIEHVLHQILAIRVRTLDALETYVTVLHTLTLRGGTLSTAHFVALLHHLPILRNDIDEACGWSSKLGADALHALLGEVTLATAQRRLPELCANRDALAMLFGSREESVRHAALTWLGEGLVTMDES